MVIRSQLMHFAQLGGFKRYIFFDLFFERSNKIPRRRRERLSRLGGKGYVGGGKILQNRKIAVTHAAVAQSPFAVT